MKNKILLFLVSLMAALWLFACRKDPPQTPRPDRCPWPDITTEGLNTFGCKINGKEWVPCIDFYGSVAGLRPLDCTITESDGSNFLSISVTRIVKDSTYSTIISNGQMFFGFKPCKEGLFNVPEGFSHSSAKLFADWENYSYELIDSMANNYLQITRLDTATNIISGLFQMTLVDLQTGKKVEITDGRFDCKYYPQ